MTSISPVNFGDLGTFERWLHAGADQVAVAVGVVDAVDRGPILVAVESGRIAAESARIRPLPLVVGEIERGMRRVLERIVTLRHAPRLYLPDFLPDGDHGVAETVDFC